MEYNLFKYMTLYDVILRRKTLVFNTHLVPRLILFNTYGIMVAKI
jgi:hypothetical protein